MPSGFPDYQAFEIPVLVPNGGTGHTSLTTNGVLLGAGTAPVTVTAAGAANEVLRVPGAGGAPAFGALDLSKAASTTGILPVTSGGSGTATPSLVAGAGISIAGSWPNQTVTNTSPASALGDPVTVAHGGTGTATPSLVAGTGISIAGSWPNQTVTNTSPASALGDPVTVAHGGWGTVDGRFTPPAGAHFYGALSLGHLQDPYIVSITPAYDSGTLPPGTYHLGVTAYDAIGESWSGDYTVTLTAQGRIVITWVPIGGAAGYYIYLGATFATAYRQATVSAGESYTKNLTSAPNSSGPTAPTGNTTGGELRASLVCSATVAGGPAFYFLNEDTGGGTSPATFHFIKAPGICAIFQDVNRTELDIQTSSGKAVQFNVPNPTGGAAELDFFLNNKLGMLMVENLNSFLVNTQLRTPETTGTHASPIWSFGNIVAGVTHEWKLLANTSDQLEIDHDAALILTLSPTILGAPALALGTPLEVAYGGTGTATPSLVAGANITITGTWPNNTIALKSPITGPLVVGNGTGGQTIDLDGDVLGDRYYGFKTAGALRWVLYTDGAPESGSNAGSNFSILRYTDAGAYLAHAISIRRSDGQVGINDSDPGKALDVNGDVRASLQLISTVAVGTAPLAVTSNTLVTNLNAERVGGTRITNVAAAGQVLVGTGDGTAEWQTP